ncbi:RDD family protein [bacterium]|nr:RDD family protein [bacterium]
MHADYSRTIHVIPEGRLYADVAPRRAIAWMIDSVVIAMLVGLMIPLTGFLALFFLGGLYLTISFLYRWLTLANGAGTLGMRIMGLTLRDRYGYPVDGLTALLHTLFYTLSVAFVFPQVISVLLMAFTRAHQGTGDIVLGTALVNESAFR